MRHCANYECPDRERPHAAEFRDDVDMCPRCGEELEQGPPPPSREAEYVELADVATFMYVHEAELAVAHLDAAGIPAHIVNRDTLGMHALLSVAIGGVKLQVEPEDAARAREVLAGVPEVDDADVQTPGAGPYRGGPTVELSPCPECGSTEETPPRPRVNWLGLLTILLIGIPLLFRPRRCGTCGARLK